MYLMLIFIGPDDRRLPLTIERKKFELQRIETV